MFERHLIFIDRHWRWLGPLAWALFCAWLLYSRWNNVMAFALGDTDDNMRMSQVRAWLNGGQGWYDLRQLKLNWPQGADIHWSRLVDLPIAGIKLALTPFMGGKSAETAAVTAVDATAARVTVEAVATVARGARVVAPVAKAVANVARAARTRATPPRSPRRS